MTAYININLRIRWEGDDQDGERYAAAMEVIRFGVEDETRSFITDEYPEARIESCEASG